MNVAELLKDINDATKCLKPEPEVVIGHMDLCGHLEIDNVGSAHSEADSMHGYINEVVLYTEIPDELLDQVCDMDHKIGKVLSTINVMENAMSHERCEDARKILDELSLMLHKLTMLAGINQPKDHEVEVNVQNPETGETRPMTISEVIAALEKIKESQGDIECMCPPCSGDNFRPVERVGAGMYDDGTVKADIMDGEGDLDD